MEYIKVEVEVAKETYESMQGAAKLTEATFKALADGFQAGQDLAAIAMVAFSAMDAINGVDLVDDEFKADPAAALKAILLSAADIYEVVKNRPKVEEPAPEPAA